MTHSALPAFLLLAVTVAIAANACRRILQRQMLHKERMEAIRHGAAAVSELLAAEEREDRRPKRNGPVLYGVIWLAIGVGLWFGTALARPATMSDAFAELYEINMAYVRIWAFPAMTLGAGLLLYGLLRAGGGAGRKNGPAAGSKGPGEDRP